MSKQDLKHRIQVAMGQQQADLVFTNGKIVSTFTEEIYQTDFAVAGGKIVALGDVGEAKETIDLQGTYVAPSFIDSHIHVESSMLSPEGFAEAVVPHGTGAVVSDPHEIVNVLGLKGYNYMVEAAAGLPIDLFYTIPSCVPATHMETAGGEVTAQDIREVCKLNPQTFALSEMMNYPGVFLGDDQVLEKICTAQELGLDIDGHSPMLKGAQLNAYLNANIRTDHECTTTEEAYEKLRKGMHVMMREGSAARNLKDLIATINDHTVHRLCLATDDRHPDDLLEKGHMDYSLQMLIDSGIDPIRAIRLMTLNPATIYGLKGHGGLGIGFYANFVLFDDLSKPKIKSVYYQGNKVAENGKLLMSLPRKDASITFNSVSIPQNLEIKLQGFPTTGKVQVIGALEGQLVTERLEGRAEEAKDGELAYLAVVERYGKNGQVGLGFVKGMGLTKGALASTVAHDNHNLILVGKSISDMCKAAEIIQEIQGGFAAVNDGQVLATVSLPVAGLMSNGSVNEVAEELKKLEHSTKDLGVTIHSPFMVLSFLALAVIPHLKLTDHGLVDVDQFKLVPLCVEE